MNFLPPGPGTAVYVLGDLPELGSDDITRAVQLVSADGVTWRVTVSLPLNRTYTYRYYERLWFAPSDPTNGTAIGDPFVGQTDPIVVRPVAKIVYVHSSLAPPVLHWRQDDGAYADLPMEDAGPGQTADERRWIAGPLGAARTLIEFYVTADDGSQRDPAGTDTYRTPLDALLLQDEHLFGYVPSASVSPQRRDYTVLPSSLSDVSFDSAVLGEPYDVRVLLPRGYDEHRHRSYPVLYHMDGSYLWEDPFFSDPYDQDGAITAGLVRLGEAAESIHVGVDNSRFAAGSYDCTWWETRARDHTPPGDTTPAGVGPGCVAVAGEADRFAVFLRDELKPWIDARYRTKPGAEHTAVSGQSQTALGAFYLGWDFSETFGGVGAQSVYLGAATNFMTHVSGEPKRDIRVYVDAGSAEFQNLSWALELRDVLAGMTPVPFAVEGDLRFVVGPGQGHSVGAAASRWPRMLPFLQSATSPPQCWDGIDNDGDGLVDFGEDSGCDSAIDESELFACEDGIDNDGDDLIDYPSDPGCIQAASNIEEPDCQDGLNNDPAQDDLIDFDGGLSALGHVATAPDPQCTYAWQMDEAPSKWRCGLGAELALLLPTLMLLRGRRGSS